LSVRERVGTVDVIISEDPRIQSIFDGLVNGSLMGEGTVQVGRMQGDRFPGPRFVSVNNCGWSLLIEFDGRDISSAHISSERLDDIAKRRYSESSKTDIQYKHNPDGLVKEALDELEERMEEEPSDMNLMNEMHAIKDMISISDIIKERLRKDI